jgi:hypothetical protein
LCSERGGGKPSDDLGAAGDDSFEARHARRMASDNKQVCHIFGVDLLADLLHLL